MNIKILEDIGFTKGEVKVYIALIGLKESTIGPISRKAQVTPSKTYPILEKLKEKGLVTYVIKSGTKYFQILDPNRIINFLNDKEKEINQQKKETKLFIKTITNKQEEKTDQYATVYESFNGIKTLYDDILDYLKTQKEDFIGFTLGDEYKDKQANLFFKNYDAKRKRLKIKTKLIGLEHQRKYLTEEYGKNSNVEIRYLKYAVPTGLTIYNDKVATLLWHKIPTAFVVHSKPNSEAYRKFFKDMWKMAKS